MDDKEQTADGASRRWFWIASGSLGVVLAGAVLWFGGSLLDSSLRQVPVIDGPPTFSFGADDFVQRWNELDDPYHVDLVLGEPLEEESGSKRFSIEAGSSLVTVFTLEGGEVWRVSVRSQGGSSELIVGELQSALGNLVELVNPLEGQVGQDFLWDLEVDIEQSGGSNARRSSELNGVRYAWTLTNLPATGSCQPPECWQDVGSLLVVELTG